MAEITSPNPVEWAAADGELAYSYGLNEQGTQFAHSSLYKR